MTFTALQPTDSFEVVERSATGANKSVRRNREYVVPRSCRSPHLVVLQHVRIHKHAQLSCVAKWGHAIIGFGNSTQIVSVICIELDFDDVSAGICEFPSKFSV